MLATGTILELDQPPIVANVLLVSMNSWGKERLIVELKYVNMHLYKDNIKFDENYLLAN